MKSFFRDAALCILVTALALTPLTLVAPGQTLFGVLIGLCIGLPFMAGCYAGKAICDLFQSK